MNVRLNAFTDDGLAFIDEEQDAAMSGSRVQQGDVLLNITGASIGRVCVAPSELCPANVNQHVCIIRSDGTLLPEWIAFFLAQPDLQKQILGQQSGATRQALTKEMIEAFNLPNPGHQIQKRIVSRLKIQMTAVEQSRQGIETMRQGLDDFVAAWIREGIQHPETTVEAVGEVLEEVTQGIGSRWAEFPVLGATRSGAAPAKDKVGKTPGRYKPVRPGSVFYNPMRIMIGSIALLDEGDAPGITSPDYVVVRPRTEAVHHLWVYEWLRSTHGARFIQTLARGGVRERMLFTRLKAGDIPVPPQAWQQRFAEISRHRRQAVKLLDEQLADLDKLPGAYLREAFGSL
jgi:type I restriction enzyme S subunit